MSNTTDKIKLYDTYINKKFKNQINNILILDSYNDLIIEWLFYNFCNGNKQSKIYCVNNWTIMKNKLMFLDVNIDLISEKINSTILGLNKYFNQIKIYDDKNEKNKIFDFYEEKINFNIVYINTAINTTNFFMDIVFIFSLLNENGIIIFDNYNLYKNNENVCDRDHVSKIALETFLHLHDDQINILYYKDQLVIEKKKYPDKLFNIISNIKTCDFLHKIDIKNTDNLLYNFKTSSNINNMEKKYGFDEEYIKIFSDSLYNVYSDKYVKYQLHSLLDWSYDFNVIYNSLNNKILNDTIKYNYDPYNKFKLLYLMTTKNADNSLFEVICKIKNNNFINQKKSISFLTISHTPRTDPDYNRNIEKFLMKEFNVPVSKFYRIDNYIFGENSEYVCAFKSIDEISKITKKINNKIDILSISLDMKTYPSMNRSSFEKNYTIELFNSILFSLMNSAIDGCSVIVFFIPLSELSMQLLWILKKYYKNIYFTCNNYTRITTTGQKLIATNFIGIDNIELEKIKEIGNKMYECDKLYHSGESTKFIYSILQIDESNIQYKKFCNSVTKYNKKKIKMIIDYNKIWYSVISYLENDKNEEEKKIKLKNLLFTIQIRFIWEWIEINKIID
jgi:hypothetical protein